MARRWTMRMAWRALLYLALWTAPGINRLAGTALYREVTGAPPLPRVEWLAELAAWWNCAIVALPVIYFARRFPLSRPHWLRNLLLHIPASLAFSLAEIGTNFLLDRIIIPVETEKGFGVYFVARLAFDELIYWVTVGVSLAFAYHARLQEKELASAQLETRLVQAQILALRAQLKPHFLFNTLNTISSLVQRDPEGAERMIARLSDLLRMSLEEVSGPLTTLRRELEFTEAYVDIMRIRFGPRLKIRVDAEPGALDALVPSLFLQPLVENAVKHAVAPRTEGGCVEITARRVGENIEVQVADDGPGLEVDPWNGSTGGLGLANTRERMLQIYGGSHRFEVVNRPSGGVRASFTARYEPAPEPPAATRDTGHAPLELPGAILPAPGR